MFKIANMRTLKERPTEMYTVGSGKITVGMVLKHHSDGTLVKSGATDTPEFIAYGAGTTGDLIPVYRVIETDVYETTFHDSGASVVEGNKVTVHTDGLKVTGTTDSGVFQVTKILGEGAAGSKVQGMFRR